MKLFVLIVIFHVNSGSAINFQEFYDKESCERVKQWVENRADYGFEAATCEPLSSKTWGQ